MNLIQPPRCYIPLNWFFSYEHCFSFYSHTCKYIQNNIKQVSMLWNLYCNKLWTVKFDYVWFNFRGHKRRLEFSNAIHYLRFKIVNQTKYSFALKSAFLNLILLKFNILFVSIQRYKAVFCFINIVLWLYFIQQGWTFNLSKYFISNTVVNAFVKLCRKHYFKYLSKWKKTFYGKLDAIDSLGFGFVLFFYDFLLK